MRGSQPGPGVRAASAGVLAVAIVLLAVAAAWPVYESSRLWLVGLSGAAVAGAIVWAGWRWRWGGFTAAALIVGFAGLLVPVAVPGALGSGALGLARGYGDGLAAVALGWKQLLTLTLPVGEYQAVLVPFLATVMAAVSAATWLALRGPTTAVYAALPALAPMLFGTIFGASAVSSPLSVGPLTIAAPRELACWIGACALIVTWIAWSAGSQRRAALRLGRNGAAGKRRLGRGLAGAAIIALAVGSAIAVVPHLDPTARAVPRDRIDPVVVVRAQTSPLASYRAWKRDAAYEAEVFSVSGSGALPDRLRLAVLDAYNGVDFTIDAETGRFARFPSGDPLPDSASVQVSITSDSLGIWMPLANGIAAPPDFGGPRGADLAEGFYLDRSTGAGILVPTSAGLRQGDKFLAPMNTAPDPELIAAPASDAPEIDRANYPQLDLWLRAQRLPNTAAGLTEAIDRLRARGYLSHSLSETEGERAWLTELEAQHGTRFVPSAGGHSAARVEQLFAQLNAQQDAAPGNATDATLVAAIGDDEQFAAAAALLAQAMGYDARAVVGVRLGGAEIPGVPACGDSCAGRNIAAWIEVRGADGVWAPLDVTPQVTTPPAALEDGEQLPEYPTVPEERDAPERDPELGATNPDSDPAEPKREAAEAGVSMILRSLGLGAAALALIALLLAFIPLVKRLRVRRRRLAENPETRALGAWETLLDAHLDAGSELPRGASRSDVALALGIDQSIAAEIDRAVFSREGIDEGAAQELWRNVDSEAKKLRNSRAPLARLGGLYSLTSFGIPRLTVSRRRPSRDDGRASERTT